MAELQRVHELMDLADGDQLLSDEVATLLMGCGRGKPLPDPRKLSRQLTSGVPNASSITVGDYLAWWITHRVIDEHTRIGYESHVRIHLNPHLGDLRLYRLSTAHIEAMFATITRRNQQILDARKSTEATVAKQAQTTRLTTPATMTRVRATLRKALNDAVAKHRLIDHNPALHVEMPQYNQPTVKVWTERAIAQWRAGGFAPSPVMVWTPEQAGAFLDYAQAHDPGLYTLFLLIILGGPRRGEAVGIRTDQIDFDARTATFSHQLTQHQHLPVYKKVKTKSGDRVIFLDAATVDDLRAYWRLRESWQTALGDSWPATVTVKTPVPGGYVPVEVDLFFRQPDGRAWHPSRVTDQFMRDTAAAGLPPIKLHGGRHAAATYMKAPAATCSTYASDSATPASPSPQTSTPQAWTKSINCSLNAPPHSCPASAPEPPRTGPKRLTRTAPDRTVPEQSHRLRHPPGRQNPCPEHMCPQSRLWFSSRLPRRRPSRSR